MAHRCNQSLTLAIIRGMKEVIGQTGVQAVLNLAQREQVLSARFNLDDPRGLLFKDLAALHSILEVSYGPRGGRGVALRAGRAAFGHLLRQTGDQIGLTDMEYRLLPTPQRIQTGLQKLAALTAASCAQPVEVTDTETTWVWRMSLCPECYRRQAAEPVCHFVTGLLQEFMAWANSGRFHHVEEIECRATGGAACVFSIDRQPLELG
ncbi:MAG TPA: 4-vinyl reductase [Anaerolineaceae bacterium]|nr:4-vinyl reductase [Anaerolineaceae bacterium]HQH85186.1 4-vinyl reductase [Anaerolineaceae bacterium]